uniref:Succinate-semialdehyde dehydrogenase, mitochondrial n=1 Tax=Cacopsylla melanoneura TaxID=428564 RepID=A0A8D8Y5B0_9HEMI
MNPTKQTLTLLEKQLTLSRFLLRSMSLWKHKAYVNGEWVDAASGNQFEVKNPANGKVLGKVPDMNDKDTEKALEDANTAFKEWSKTTGKERGIALRKWYDLLVQNKQALAEILTAEAGKPIPESLGEVDYGNAFVDWFAEEARRSYGEVVPSPVKSKEMLLIRQPIGVTSLITPWNFPYAMITRKAGAAIAAGCTCVVKPAEDTPYTALAIAELAHQAGIPKGVYNVVTSDRKNAPAIGKVLSQHPLVAGLSFTGSTEVGKLLYQQCAVGVKRIALELGGNAPFMVFESADMDLTIQGALASKFRNCGQTCISANRFLIHESRYDEFISKFSERIKALKIGDGAQPGVLVGPLINQAQVKKITRIVDDAIKKGANVLLGGKPAPNYGELYYEPTLITDITPAMDCYLEEIFGPVAVCIKFKTEEECVEIANMTRRGLAGYFYTEDIRQAWRVAKNLEVGMVGVNESLISAAEAAFGGIKESGIGREGSKHGLDDFSYIKYVCFGSL